MTGLANDQTSLEAALKDEIIRMYQEVADNWRAPSISTTAGRRRSFSVKSPTGSTGHHPVRWPRSQGWEIHMSGATCRWGRPSSTWGVVPAWMH